jgi:hypothetical protein
MDPQMVCTTTTTGTTTGAIFGHGNLVQCSPPLKPFPSVFNCYRMTCLFWLLPQLVSSSSIIIQVTMMLNSPAAMVLYTPPPHIHWLVCTWSAPRAEKSMATPEGSWMSVSREDANSISGSDLHAGLTACLQARKQIGRPHAMLRCVKRRHMRARLTTWTALRFSSQSRTSLAARCARGDRDVR